MLGQKLIFSIMVVCSMLMLFAGNVAAQDPYAGVEPEFYLGIEYFTWQEFDDFKQSLLNESGTRFAAGFAVHKVFESGMTLKPRVELFTGTVNYDGATMGGVPALSETEYYGLKAEFDLGGQIGERVIFEPFAGIGFRGWDRIGNDGLTVLGTPVIGYTEEWSMSYWRLGFRLTPQSDDSRGYFELGLRVPIQTENTALLSEKFLASDLTFKPGDQNSIFAEAGLRAGSFKIATFFETLRFKASPPVVEPFSGIAFYQPTSKANIFGIRIGAAF